MLEALRKTVADLHAELPRNGLVAWTSGNVSGRDPETGLIVIKPSGLRFEDLGPENMVVVDANGKLVESTYKASSDTATHCYIYREMPEVGGIVHTHSSYATAWAALGRDIPCVLTAMADEFGGPIPCGGFALIGGEEIGREVVRVLREGPNPHSPAVLLQNHGVFTVGPTPLAAIKAAVMCEDVARTVALAYRMGEPLPISEEDIASLHHRYTHVYGQ
ncbi:MAG: L-ribulose-5-phosphate 4-epimerase [Chloroflexi bacterium]|nr:L-ribulose-5-phosphate 4-epimerase [Chloroflexota bacterium]